MAQQYDKEFKVNAVHLVSEQGKKRTFDYIEIWYDRERIHSSIAYVSPAECERRYLQKAQSQASRRMIV